MFLIAAAAAFILAFVVVGLFSYRLVKPLRQMSAAAKSFGDGDFSIRVPVTSNDEIGQLATAFNNMADSLSGSESMNRSFVANVSHELKTPMTTIAASSTAFWTAPFRRSASRITCTSSPTRSSASRVLSALC